MMIRDIVMWGLLVAYSQGAITEAQLGAAVAAFDAGTVRQSQAQPFVNRLTAYLANVQTQSQQATNTLAAWFQGLPP